MVTPHHQQIHRHLQSGLEAQAAGNPAAAASAYEAALRLAPEHPDALNLMGTALLQLGHADAAADHLRRAARLMKNNPGVHGNLGQACIAAGDYAGAQAAFRKASRLEPSNVYYQLGTASALAMQGHLGEAENLLRNQSRRFPNEPLVWFNLGNVLRDLGRPAEGLDCFDRTLAMAPDHIDARNNRGGVLHALERYDEAAREYRACIDAAPDYVLPRMNLASLLTDLGQFGDAEAELRRVIGLAPTLTDAQLWLGSVLSQQGRMQAALECFRAVAAGDPHHARAVEACASMLMEHGLCHAGLREFARALVLDASAARRNAYCVALLAAGQFCDGWAEYASRPAAIRTREAYPDLRLSSELPSDLAGTPVCLVKEQGLGDEIFFLRFARELHARGARITYRANRRLRGMLSRTPFLDTVLEENAPLPPAAATLLIGDLPQALYGLPATALPAADPPAPVATTDYAQRIAVFWPLPAPGITLQPLDERIAAMRERLARAGPPPYLGLTWRAGTPPKLQRGSDWVLHKSVAPSLLGTAVSAFPGTLLALQRHPDPAEIEATAAASDKTVHDFSAVNDELEDMLALLAIIDEYVSVSNTNIHLRAATGKSTRVLVPRPAEWRWMTGGRESPWFPGSPVYRQALDGDWSSALALLADDLKLCQT